MPNPGRQKHEINLSEVTPDLELSVSVSTKIEQCTPLPEVDKKAGRTPLGARRAGNRPVDEKQI